MEQLMQEAARDLEPTVRYRPVAEILAGGDRKRRRHTVRVASSGVVGISLAAGIAWTAFAGLTQNGDMAGQTSTTAPATSAAMSQAPAPHADVRQYLPANGTTAGVGQPISILLDSAPSEQARAAVEKALVVTTEPHVAGAWHWIDATRVDWRPQRYWASGTKVSVHIGLSGTRGGQDFSFTIGPSVVSTVDLQTDVMTVTQDGSVLKRLPVTGGSDGKRTWSGAMVVLDKHPTVTFSSTGVEIGGSGYYRLEVAWDVRLTDSGSYIYAAPWEALSLGMANTTDGVIGLSTQDAQWFYNLTQPGDVVVVQPSSQSGDTPRQGNGFSDWNLTWQQWLAGSAAGIQPTP